MWGSFGALFSDSFPPSPPILHRITPYFLVWRTSLDWSMGTLISGGENPEIWVKELVAGRLFTTYRSLYFYYTQNTYDYNIKSIPKFIDVLTVLNPPAPAASVLQTSLGECLFYGALLLYIKGIPSCNGLPNSTKKWEMQ